MEPILTASVWIDVTIEIRTSPLKHMAINKFPTWILICERYTDTISAEIPHAAPFKGRELIPNMSGTHALTLKVSNKTDAIVQIFIRT